MKSSLIKIAIIVAMLLTSLCYVEAQTKYTTYKNVMYKWDGSDWILSATTYDGIKIIINHSIVTVYAKEKFIYTIYKYVGDMSDSEHKEKIWKIVDDGGVSASLIAKSYSNILTLSFMYDNTLIVYYTLLN